MSEAAELYAGLDQMIAKPTKEEAPASAAGEGSGKPVTAERARPEAPASFPEKKGKQPAAALESDGNLVRRLDPDPPEALDLYRKQTLHFGPRELDAIHKMQAALADGRARPIGKNDLVRAAIEFLLKDFDTHKDQSFVTRKFVRR